MRDRLERLEKLGYLVVDDWLRWRELGNRLAHEYPDQPELRFAVLKAAIDTAGQIVAGYERSKCRIGARPRNDSSGNSHHCRLID